MNKLFALGCSALLVFACNTASHDATAQDQAREASGKPLGMTSYGAEITPDGAMSMAEFTEAMAGTESMDAKVEGEINATCAVKGCWMDMRLADGSTMKVRFKDYGFFVPKQGMEGKVAILQGTATRETVDVATLRHYAEDAGKSQDEIEAITEPETSIGFIAEGVLIRD